MSIFENIRLALQAIRANGLRTLLTCMIIAFGIMALVGILTAIDSLQNSLQESFASVGSNSFNIVPSGQSLRGRRRGNVQKAGSSITLKEAESFKERFQFPSDVAISVMAKGGATLQAQGERTNPTITIQGIDENYLRVSGYNLSTGRGFSSDEAQRSSQTVILGSAVAKNLFGDAQKGIDSLVRIQSMPFRVVGVLEEKGSSASFSGDKMAFIPIYTARQRFGKANTSFNLTVSVPNVEQIDLAALEAEGVFRSIRGLRVDEESDFVIRKSNAFIERVKENTLMIRLAAVFIGLITLTGAAIGLMNIMLVSVTERTREIGISKSIGATHRVIRTQFLTEAIVICQLGGAIGILLGILAGNIVTFLTGGSFVIPWAWMALGVALCFITGLISGLYPAIKASKLDPIEALRYE